MHLSTSYLSQAGFDTSVPCRRVPIDNSFQFALASSNSHIYPTYHPMSNFHHQQTQGNPFLMTQDPRFSYMPQKKVKINDNSERVVQNNIHAQLSQVSQSTSEFRTHNIPSKVIVSKHQHAMEQLKHKKMPNVELKQKNQKEQLMLVDPRIEDFSAVYEKKIETFQQELDIQKKLFLHQVIKGKIMEYSKWLKTIKSQNSEKNTENRSAEDILKDEHITRQIKQHLLPLLKLCKKNQQDLAQYVKSPVLAGSGKQNYQSQPIFENIYKIEAEANIMVKQESPL